MHPDYRKLAVPELQLSGQLVNQELQRFAQLRHTIRHQMFINKIALLIFTCLFLSSTAWCTGEGAAGSPQALISRARSQEDLWTEGTPPMEMRAELQLPGAGGV